MHLKQNFEISERRACRVIGQPRSTQRYTTSQPKEANQRLLKRMVALSEENPRYGYRRVWALLKREGWQVNKKRVHRLWREQGLKVSSCKQRKRRRMGSSENGCTRRRAEHKDHVWNLYENVKLQIGPRRWFRHAASPTTHSPSSWRGRSMPARASCPPIACDRRRLLTLERFASWQTQTGRRLF